MLELIAYICLFGGASLLVILSIIDLRTYLLPNIYVGLFALTGILFHLSTQFTYLHSFDMALGALFGFGGLFAIRKAANHFYKTDALGLGDVKLLGAAGLWLGIDGVLLAMTLGAIAGLIHGLVYAAILAGKTGQPIALSGLRVPAGPGFAAGIIASAIVLFFKAPLF